MKKIKDTVAFDDVLLVPQYSEVMSRKDIDLSNQLSKSLTLDLPIISAPMDTVVNATMVNTLSDVGCLGVMHRYNDIPDQASMMSRITGTKAAAIGITGDYLDRAATLVSIGVEIICVDVAHGHHVLAKRALKQLRSTVGEDIHIMAGNVATLEAFNDLSDWGADSIRVGIGGGSICSTRIQTGHGVPTLQSVLDCSLSDRPAKLIADGGIKTSGDMVKALAAGADFVMVGSLLAGTTESPGGVVYVDEKQFKSYRGMASVEAQIDWRGHASSIEGVSHMVPYRGPVRNIIKNLEGGIRSGLSYSGALNISELQNKAQFIKQTSAGLYESKTHIKARY